MLKKIFLPLILAFSIVCADVPATFANNAIPNVQIGSGKDGQSNLTGLDDFNEGNKEDALNKVLTEYRTIVTFISAIGTISMIMFFIFNFIQLGKSQGNPQERQKAITGLIMSGLASAGLGSVTLITSLFYKMLGDPSEDPSGGGGTPTTPTPTPGT